jgi:hypothetical protein
MYRHRLQYSVQLPGVQFHKMVCNDDEHLFVGLDCFGTRLQRCKVFGNDRYLSLSTLVGFTTL